MDKLWNGEQKHGRTILLKELENEKAKLTFIRFINKGKVPRENKIIGGEKTADKKTILRETLRLINNSTQP